MAQEEFAELIVAISHRQRNKATLLDLVEECVDAELMIHYLRWYIFNSGHLDLWEKIKKTKLDRLDRLIEEARHNK